MYPCINLSIYLSVYLSVYLPTCLSAYLSVCLFICLSIYRSICLSVSLSVYVSICHEKWQLKVQKCSEADVFLVFWLRNAFRTTMVCTFSTAQLQKMLWTRGVFNVLRATFTCTFCGPQPPKVLWNWGVLTIFAYFCFQICFAPQRGVIFDLSSDNMSLHPLF